MSNSLDPDQAYDSLGLQTVWQSCQQTTPVDKEFMSFRNTDKMKGFAEHLIVCRAFIVLMQQVE